MVKGYKSLDIVDIFPYRAVQLIVQASSAGTPEMYRGSCFRLWSPNHFLTARHCVEDLTAERVLIVPLTEPGRLLHGAAVARHSSADVAIVEVTDPIPEDLQQLRLGTHDALATKVHLFGPVLDHPERVDTFRVLTGSIQRAFIHDGYKALEFSQPIPVGMSGAPCYKEYPSGHVIGIATSSIDSEIVIARGEEVECDGKVTRTVYTRATQYGVLAAIDPLTDWIREILGPPPA